MAIIPQSAPPRQPPQYQGQTAADSAIQMLNYQRGLESAMQRAQLAESGASERQTGVNAANLAMNSRQYNSADYQTDAQQAVGLETVASNERLGGLQNDTNRLQLDYGNQADIRGNATTQRGQNTTLFAELSRQQAALKQAQIQGDAATAQAIAQNIDKITTALGQSQGANAMGLTPNGFNETNDRITTDTRAFAPEQSRLQTIELANKLGIPPETYNPEYGVSGRSNPRVGAAYQTAISEGSGTSGAGNIKTTYPGDKTATTSNTGTGDDFRSDVITSQAPTYAVTGGKGVNSSAAVAAAGSIPVNTDPRVYATTTGSSQYSSGEPTQYAIDQEAQNPQKIAEYEAQQQAQYDQQLAMSIAQSREAEAQQSQAPAPAQAPAPVPAPTEGIAPNPASQAAATIPDNPQAGVQPPAIDTIGDAPVDQPTDRYRPQTPIDGPVTLNNLWDKTKMLTKNIGNEASRQVGNIQNSPLGSVNQPSLEMVTTTPEWAELPPAIQSSLVSVNWSEDLPGTLEGVFETPGIGDGIMVKSFTPQQGQGSPILDKVLETTAIPFIPSPSASQIKSVAQPVIDAGIGVYDAAQDFITGQAQQASDDLIGGESAQEWYDNIVQAEEKAYKLKQLQLQFQASQSSNQAVQDQVRRNAQYQYDNAGR